jgi:hypothetical protein
METFQNSEGKNKSKYGRLWTSTELEMMKIAIGLNFDAFNCLLW